MSIDPGLLILSGAGVAVTLVFGYAAYWGLRVRGVLVDRLYKRRAQWVAVVGAVFALLVVSNLVFGEVAPANWYLSLVQFILQYAGAALTFASVDATIRVGIKTDPLERDTLHWRILRLILWTGVGINVLGGLAQVVYFRTNFYTTAGGPQGALIYGPFGNLLAFIVLLVARSRSKDLALRRHMLWFSLFALVLLFASSDPLYRFEPGHYAVTGLLFLGAAFLYLSAKSLVPVKGPMPMAVEKTASGNLGGQNFVKGAGSTESDTDPNMRP